VLHNKTPLFVLHNKTPLFVLHNKTRKGACSKKQGVVAPPRGRADCTFLRREMMMGPPRCAYYYLYHYALAVVFIAAALLFRAVSALTSDDESDTGLCTSDWCTSPDGEGGYDCWAGSPTEGCTCEEGKARETGRSIEHEGRTYYGYVCCTTDDGTTNGTNGTTTGEHCGDFKGDSKDTKEIEGVIGGIVFVLFAIGLGIGIWACCRRRCGGGRNGGGGCCQPKSEYHVGESTTSHNNTRQPMMWSSNVELGRTKNDAAVPDAYKTPDNYYR